MEKNWKYFFRKLHNKFVKFINISYESNKLIGWWGQIINIDKIKKDDGKYYIIKFRISHNFDLGKMYIGDDKILYLFNKEYEKFALNALKQIGSLKYANEDMKKEFNR